MQDDEMMTPSSHGLSAAASQRRGEYMPNPTRPAEVAARMPTYDTFARETFGLPDEWQHVSWQVKGEGAAKYFELVGGVFPEVYKSGKRKGETHWGKPLGGKTETVVVIAKQFKDWVKHWEAETGFCAECLGTGLRWCGWNHERGNRFEPCSQCNETGRLDRDGSRGLSAAEKPGFEGANISNPLPKDHTNE